MTEPRYHHKAEMPFAEQSAFVGFVEVARRAFERFYIEQGKTELDPQEAAFFRYAAVIFFQQTEHHLEGMNSMTEELALELADARAFDFLAFLEDRGAIEPGLIPQLTEGKR